MRFATIFTLGALLAPALASPLLDNSLNLKDNELLNENEFLNENEILTDIISDNEVLSDLIEIEPVLSILEKVNAIEHINAKRNAISSSDDVINTCQELLISIKTHTANINETAAEPSAMAEDDAKTAAIVVELNLIVDLVKTACITLGSVKEVFACSPDQLHNLVSIIVCIIMEIVCTVLHVLKSLNIKVALSLCLSNLCQVLAGLCIILEHIVGGVLVLLLECLNVPAILALVAPILTSLTACLSLGKIVPA